MAALSRVKPKLVPAGSDFGVFTKLVLYAITSIIGLALISGLVGGAPTIVLVSFSVLFTFFLSGLMLDFIHVRRARRASTILNGLIEDLSGGVLRFSRPMKARHIIYEAVGWRGASYRYYFTAHITPRGGYTVASTHYLGDPSYGIVVGRGGEGAVSLPGLEFDEPGLHGIILLYIPPRQPLIEPTTLNLAEPGGGRVTVRLHGGEGVRGEAVLTGGGKARVYLVAKLLEANLRLRLADLMSRGKVSFSARLAPDQPVFVVVYRRSSPRAIANRLGKNVVAGNMPQYSLVVELTKPLRRRFKTESRLHIAEPPP